MATYDENEQKLWGTDITGDIREPKSKYHHFERSVRRLIADYFTRTGEKLDSNFVKSFNPTGNYLNESACTVYIYGNDKIYSFSLGDLLKIYGEVIVYDMKKLSYADVSYKYDDDRTENNNKESMGYSMKRPEVECFNLTFETGQFLQISSNAFNEDIMNDIADYIFQYI